MSDLVVPFLYELRARKLKVGATEALALAKAMGAGAHESSLERFYHVARALCVHREGDLDAFDVAFAAHFEGVERAAAKLTDELLSWLNDPVQRRELSEEERAALEALSLEELHKRFEERLREQKERHDGGNRWIGTGGTSPFGRGGTHPTGMIVGQGGSRSAVAMARQRRFRPYREDDVLDVRQFEVALRKLRQLARDGRPDELDVEETVRATGQNAGELDIKLRAPRRSSVRVLLLMDVGGSMDPYADVVSKLFSATKRASHLREVKPYYFHNCVYGHVFGTANFTEPVSIDDLLHRCGPQWKLVMVGDAAMNPAELLGYGDYSFHSAEARRAQPGLAWMEQLAGHFERRAWLNPDPPQYWRGGTAEVLARIFPMFSLTVQGLDDATKHLVGQRPHEPVH